MGNSLRRSTGLATAVVMTFVVVGTADPAGAEPSPEPCSPTIMQMPAGLTFAELADSDPTGRFQVGYGRDSDDVFHLVRWTDGVPEDLGSAHYDATAVNEHGDIAGSDYDVSDGVHRPWRYHDGQFTP